MNAADELRAAAAKLRALAKAIEAPGLRDQTWHTEECADDQRGNCPCIVAQGTWTPDVGPTQPLFYVADAETRECAAYIAAMGPPVALALADWLDWMAESAPSTAWALIDTSQDRALAVARALNPPV